MASGYGEGTSSHPRERFAYQVFLSFRGEDVRKTFISHLHHALEQKGISTFYDDSELPRGYDIQSKLYAAIETSKLAIVTFSPGYATSRWCLNELVRIMECRTKESHGLIVIPVFFGVDATHLRKQSGPYQEAFDKHDNVYKDELHRVQRWRHTLMLTADVAGFCLQNKANGFEALLIEHIIAEVVKKLDTRQLSIPKHIVGAESLIEKISSWLQNGSSETEAGIIYGLGGVGKTTVAKVVYNYHQFKFSSFLAEIRSSSQNVENVIHLQEQLIFNISGNEAKKIHNVHVGKEMIRMAIGSKKTLVVFDDVDEAKQLEAMIESAEWFFPGSKILITTRNQEWLNVVGVTTVMFEVCALNVEKSTELFCHHAFCQKKPPDDFTKISKLFIEYCDGLPLALEVLASSLRSQKLERWEGQYLKLKDVPNKTVHSVLKLSFESLDDSNDKDIFLHIAFFMIGMKKYFPLIILEGCGLHGMIGLENLISRCLVSVDTLKGTLVMHHLIQQMAYQVVREKDGDELGQRSRLLGDESNQVLVKKMGKSAVKGLQLDVTCLKPSKPIKTAAFKKMYNLDLLLLENVQLNGDFEDFPQMIKWLYWKGFPLESIPPDLELEHLTVLDMQASFLVNAWVGKKDMGALRILDLSYSKFLICTPDLSNALLLEFLFLKDCVNLIEVHESIGNLTKLRHLNAEGCVKLVKMHDSIGNLEKLSILNLKGCKNLVSCPFPISVVELNLAKCISLFTGIGLGKPLPSSLPLYPHLPISFDLPFLTELRLVDCGISRQDILELLSCAPSLNFLDLRDNPIRVLSNKKMHPFLKLNLLSLRGCTKLQSVSHLPRNCELNAERCSSLRSISYIYDRERPVRSMYGASCTDLVEVDYGCNDRVVFKLTNDMYEHHANQLGFPNLHNFFFGSILNHTDTDLNYRKRGFYRAGTYQAYRLDDHLGAWFDVTSTESELHYIVPSDKQGIQTLNLGFVGSGDNRDFSINYVKVTNSTRAWEWRLDTPSGNWLAMDNAEVTLTWLSHWCVMEHREINPGDKLHVSASTHGFFWIERWGIKIIYAEQHVDEDSIKEHVNDKIDKLKITSVDPCSASIQLQIMSMSGEASSLTDQENIVDEEEEQVFGSARPRLLDLSIYQTKRQLDDDENENLKLREYHVPYSITRL